MDDAKLKGVLVFVAGGTIGLLGERGNDQQRRKYVRAEADDLRHWILGGSGRDPIPIREGGLRRNARIHVEFRDLRTDSPNIEEHDSSKFVPQGWVKIARKIYDAIKATNRTRHGTRPYDGFVVLHGLDTLAFSASGVAFLLGAELDVPVVFTGAQRPLDYFRSDAIQNARAAIVLAAGCTVTHNSAAAVREVCVFSGDRLLRATRASTVSASAYSAFGSPNFPPLASVGETIAVAGHLLKSRGQSVPTSAPTPRLDARVVVKDVYPGLGAGAIESACRIDDGQLVDGLLLRAYGMGTIPTSERIVANLKGLTDSGVTVMLVTQAWSGSVTYGQDPIGLRLGACGVLFAGDMTFEAAYSKMICVLSQYSKPSDRRRLLIKSICGEMSTDAHRFDYGSATSSLDPRSLGYSWSGEPTELVSQQDLPLDSQVSYVQLQVFGLQPTSSHGARVAEVRVTWLNAPGDTQSPRVIVPDGEILRWTRTPGNELEPVNVAFDVTADVYDLSGGGPPRLRFDSSMALTWDGLVLTAFAQASA